MKIKRNIRTTSAMNMASSSDIAFLLIIFFLVTSAFIFKDGLQMMLPSKNKKPNVVEEREITTVLVEGENLLKLNKRIISIDDLEKELKLLIAKDPDAIMLLKIGKDVVYQRVIDVIDIMKITDVKKLSLRMIEKS